VRAVIATFLVVATLAGCGESTSRDVEAGSFLGQACAVEVGMTRAATAGETRRFIARLNATTHVKRVDVVTRQRVIQLFKVALRNEGYSGERYERYAKRAERFAGPTLLAIPDEPAHVPQIVTALQTLPATVDSVSDRPSCKAG
jgi:hypothetical protein